MTRVDPIVLVVEADRDLADLYREWLEERWPVVSAHGGREALDALEAEPPVALIDRQLNDIHGDRLIGHAREQDLNCRIAMLTTVEPGIDVAKLGFDDYLVKPLSKEALLETVEALLLRVSYDELLDEYYSLAVERARMTAERDLDSLEDDDEYRELTTRLSCVRTSLDEVLSELSEHDAYVDLCEELSGRDGLDDVLPEL